MRFLLSAIIVAGAIASGTVASQAQQGCTNRGVTKGYMLTGHGGRGSCCQNVAGAGVCSLKTCKVGTSPGLSLSGLPQYIYSQSFSWKICGIKVVQH